MAMRPFAFLSLVLASGLARPLHVHDPVGSVQGLITRILGPEYVSAFSLSVIPADLSGNDTFVLGPGSGNARVSISGNRGISISAGLYSYLKSFCNASVTWGKRATGSQLASVPPAAQLPIPTTTTKTVSPVKIRYSQNTCTSGYSTLGFTFDRSSSSNSTLPVDSSITWEEELDRFALWGVSHPLAFAGQEWAELLTYLQAGLSMQDVLTDYLTSPAFLPWQRMGNIQRLNNLGLNETLAWITLQRDLQLKILERARSFGMTPVLAGFAGHVPEAFITKLYPNASYSRAPSWNGFNATVSENFLLDPNDPLFVQLGANFTRTMIETYGLNPSDITSEIHLNADTFNEVDPTSTDPAYLQACNAAVYSAMAQGVPTGVKAVYVMQGWLFLHEYWTADRIQAYLAGVDNDSMVILDLYTDSIPIWNRPGVNSYFGKPFVWNMLLIFGGRRGIFGNFSRIAEQPLIDLNTPGSTMVGIGYTLEAIEHGLPLIDLLFDVAWRQTSPDVDHWVSNWVVRRYGKDSPYLQQAWSLLKSTVYSISYDYDTTEHFCELEKTPELQVPSGVVPHSAVFPQVLRLFVIAGLRKEVDTTLSTYRYDLVDVARQALCVLYTDLINTSGAEYVNAASNASSTSRQTDAVLATIKAMAVMVQDLDDVLATDINFLLGTWLHDARLWARKPNGTDVSVNLQKFARDLDSDARNLVTQWGYYHSGVEDYASKNGWAGLVKDYYGGRWQLFNEFLQQSVDNNYSPIDWTGQYNSALESFENGWVSNQDNITYSDQPSGKDTLQLALSIADTYFGGLTVTPYVPPASKYRQFNGSDAVPPSGSKVSVDIVQAQTVDIAALQWLCDIDPACSGFNSVGALKNDTSNIVPSQEGATLWVKL
jgi:alpha-N-acetylglucosaminidase